MLCQLKVQGLPGVTDLLQAIVTLYTLLLSDQQSTLFSILIRIQWQQRYPFEAVGCHKRTKGTLTT